MAETSIFANYWHDNRIEREFVASGYECCTRTNDLGHRFGYVALPDGHPLFGIDTRDVYENDAPDVDGGITFAEGMGGKWVFGWDAAHCWHKPDPSIMGADFRKRYEKHPEMYWHHDANAVMIDADMAELETRRFAEKLRAMDKTLKRPAEYDDYFYLPKPKQGIVRYLNPQLVPTVGGCKMLQPIEIIDSAIRSWGDEIDKHVMQRICEIWGEKKTCTMQPTYIDPPLRGGGKFQEYECSNCGEYNEVTNYYGVNSRPNYCMYCGAEVVWND